MKLSTTLKEKPMAKSTTKPMTPERLAELKHNASCILHEIRMKFLSRYPFLGNVALNLELVPVRDPALGTAATDGKKIYFDIDFLSRLNVEQTMFVLGHEVYHNVMMHFLRKESRDIELFNIATDLEVNQLLKKDGFPVLDCALMPSKLDLSNDCSAEEYYDMLIEWQKYSQKHYVSGFFEGSSGKSSCPKSMDVHIYGKNEELKPARTSDKYGEVTEHDEDFCPEPTKENITRIREIAVAAAQSFERTRGTLPDHIKKIINSMLKPEIKWQDVLAQFAMKTNGAGNTSWSRPNRRFTWSGTFLPSKESPSLKIAVGLDTSGSIDQDTMARFLGEIKGISDCYPQYAIDILQCDARIQKASHFASDEMPIDLASKEFRTVSGGGGTVMKPVFDYISLNGLDIDACVMFTDGDIDEQNASDAPEYPVLWVTTQREDKIHFGEIVRFKPAA